MALGRAFVLLAAIACFAGALGVVVLTDPDVALADDVAGSDPAEESRPDAPPEEDPLPVTVDVHAPALAARWHTGVFGTSIGVGPRSGEPRGIHRPPEV